MRKIKIKDTKVKINVDIQNEIDNIPEYFIDTEDVKISDKAIFINGKNGWYKIANFGFIIKYLIKDTQDNVFRIIEIPKYYTNKDIDKQSLFIKISNDDIASAARLRRVLLKNQLVFKGSDFDLMKILENMDSVKICRQIEILGYDKESESYFFANAAIHKSDIYYPNEFGMVTIEKQSYFMPYVDSELGEQIKKFKNAERFIYSNNEVSFNQWYELLYEAHKESVILPVCFAISSFFRDIIFNKLHFAPILYLKGIRGSGKSSLARNLTSLFGFPQHEISLKSPNTTKSLPRLMGQLSNSVLWLDEFHNNLSDDIRGMLQSVYDGGGYEKAAFTTGIETKSVDILSMLMLTSNYIPDDEIFFSRTIMLLMNDATKTLEQRTAYKKLVEIEKLGLSTVAFDLIQNRKLIIDNWHEVYEKIFKALSNKLTEYKIDNRFLENLSAIVTIPYILIRERKIILKDKLKYENDLIKIAEENIKSQYKIFYDNNLSLEFWNIIQMLYDRQYIKKDVDLKIIRNADEEILAIRFNRLYQFYQKEIGNKARDKNEIQEHITNTDAYLCSKPSVRFIKVEDEPFTDMPEQVKITDQKQYSITSALFFDYKKLSQTIGITF